MNTELEQIPVLGDDNTELQVCSYLKWLWRSPFRYHLDDDLKNIVWSGLDKHPSDEILDRLATNLERAYQFAGATYNNDKDCFKHLIVWISKLIHLGFYNLACHKGKVCLPMS